MEWMSVEELCELKSTDAMCDNEERFWDVYEEKRFDVEMNEKAYAKLDEPLRNGTIDPVLIYNGSIMEGHHRIVRAMMIGVKQLPVSSEWESQQHDEEWTVDYVQP